MQSAPQCQNHHTFNHPFVPPPTQLKCFSSETKTSLFADAVLASPSDLFNPVQQTFGCVVARAHRCLKCQTEVVKHDIERVVNLRFQIEGNDDMEETEPNTLQSEDLLHSNPLPRADHPVSGVFSSEQVALEDLIKTTFQSSLEVFACEHCQHRQAESSSFVSILPQVLVLSVNRFKFDGTSTTKIQTPVIIPRQLDLTPHTRQSTLVPPPLPKLPPLPSITSATAWKKGLSEECASDPRTVEELTTLLEQHLLIKKEDPDSLTPEADTVGDSHLLSLGELMLCGKMLGFDNPTSAARQSSPPSHPLVSSPIYQPPVTRHQTATLTKNVELKPLIPQSTDDEKVRILMSDQLFSFLQRERGVTEITSELDDKFVSFLKKSESFLLDVFDIPSLDQRRQVYRSYGLHFIPKEAWPSQSTESMFPLVDDSSLSFKPSPQLYRPKPRHGIGSVTDQPKRQTRSMTSQVLRTSNTPHSPDRPTSVHLSLHQTNLSLGTPILPRSPAPNTPPMSHHTPSTRPPTISPTISKQFELQQERFVAKRYARAGPQRDALGMLLDDMMNLFETKAEEHSRQLDEVKQGGLQRRKTIPQKQKRKKPTGSKTKRNTSKMGDTELTRTSTESSQSKRQSSRQMIVTQQQATMDEGELGQQLNERGAEEEEMFLNEPSGSLLGGGDEGDEGMLKDEETPTHLSVDLFHHTSEAKPNIEKEVTSIVKPTSPQTTTFQRFSACSDERAFGVEGEIPKYSLSALIVHHSDSVSHGHYKSYVYQVQSKKWRCFNDSRVTETTLDDILVDEEIQKDCYLLFYSRLDSK
ncbi:putative Ubiquitin carboxyl-terminal hydrolase [Blattamonas nauphoetae]|uniref:Ubiquitin carboxyl-terminal hydrolase n=1 Tax=Blattamonas nauphoetae TaxID=2049346 RepID=A0ABQ9YHZ0_9EUKA|nr:putative Ubiquitin carboxyl-terminal hydrolase [Blattamonas nauphoetae]